jgi:hypothetical protein
MPRKPRQLFRITLYILAPRARFEHTVSLFERFKTVQALCRSATAFLNFLKRSRITAVLVVTPCNLVKYLAKCLCKLCRSLNTESAASSEILVNSYQTTQRHIPENNNLYSHSFENIPSHKLQPALLTLDVRFFYFNYK